MALFAAEASGDDDIARTVELLGGREAISAASSLEVHDLILDGFPASTIEALVAETGLALASMEEMLGISTRTYQRRMRDREALSPAQSERVWKFAEILGRSRAIFGSDAAAEAWLDAPALGLDQRRPIDLLATTVGVRAVEDYLTRIDYGVYT